MFNVLNKFRMPARSTKEQFIRKAKQVHGDRYAYDKVQYVNNATKVCIVCKTHGDFYQKPNGHLCGKGCPRCAKRLKKATPDFIYEAKSIHGSLYDYSECNYVTAHQKVRIICPVHGVFLQTPHQHLRGEGCPSCSGKMTITTEEFISRAKEIHGERYGYDRVRYINGNSKVEITCPIHGVFFQTPQSHLRGNGCAKCGGTATLTNEDFIVRARIIHGWKYDYSEVRYVNIQTPVLISCPSHGVFAQTPASHLNGSGCPQCAAYARSTKKMNTQEEFLVASKKIHGDEYDYSRVEYRGSTTPVIIICREHGLFNQTPKAHLKGHGCPKCHGRNRTTDEFISEALKLHGDKYDYSRVQYAGSNTKVSIICRIHGEYLQTPHSHLSGAGCPVCGNSVLRTTKDFIARAQKVHGNKYDYKLSVYRGAHRKLSIICPSHGEFVQVAKCHLNGSGCPVCRASNLEKEIQSELSKNGIQCYEEYSFPWLRSDDGVMKLDFYVPKYNVAIECQGIQHFSPVDFFGGVAGFHSTKKRDAQKRELCYKNGIRLLYYSNLKIEYPYPVYTSVESLLRAITNDME